MHKVTAPLPATKTLALIAHDNCKPALLDWASQHQAILAEHDLCATGTTGAQLAKTLGLPVRCFLSGPLGGDQQIGAAIAEGQVHALIFFWDPFQPMPHDPDVKALLRLASVWNIPVACNSATASLLIGNPAFGAPLERAIPDLALYQQHRPQ